LEPEVEQLGALRVVVVLLELYPRVRYVLDAPLNTQLPRGVYHHLCQLPHAKLFRKLVEHAKLTLLGRVEDRQLDAPHRVAYV
jgi:hypothetical protein